MKNIFVGIDVASEKHSCCIINQNLELLSQFEFCNNRDGFNKLLHVLSCFSSSKCNIGLEATGVYGENLSAFLRRNGYEATTFNPLSVKKQLSATTLRKTKTDKSDARFIATMLAQSNIKPDTPVLYHHSELKSLSRTRFSLVKKRSAAKNVASALVSKLFPEYLGFFSDNFGVSSLAVLTKYSSAKALSGCHALTLSKLLEKSSRGRFGSPKAKELIALAKSSVGTYSPADELSLQLVLEQIELFNKQIKTLEEAMKAILDEIDSPVLSIPGIGTVLGAIIVSEIGNINRFSNPNKLLAFAGLEPSVYQSGKFTPASGTMVKRGSPYLRWALLQAARLVPQSSQTFACYLSKKQSEGKHFNVATSHVSKKLVRVIFSLSKSNAAFIDNFSA